jgi:hypothetical protein
MKGFRCALVGVIALLAIAITTNQASARGEKPEPKTQPATDTSGKYNCPKPIHRRKAKPTPAPIQCVAAPTPPPPIVLTDDPLPGPPILPPVDQPGDSYLRWIAAILEILGLFLLAREVFWGQKMEKLRKNMEFGKQMNFLYTRQDYEGAYLFNRLDQGDTPEKAREWIQILGAAAIQTSVDDSWRELGTEIALSSKRYEEETEPSAMVRRRLWLFTGTGCLMIAAVMHVLA